MGPRSTAEYQDCRVVELETALEAERETRERAQDIVRSLLIDLQTLHSNCEEYIREIDEWLKR